MFCFLMISASVFPYLAKLKRTIAVMEFSAVEMGLVCHGRGC